MAWVRTHQPNPKDRSLLSKDSDSTTAIVRTGRQILHT
jgi:hypothetical protein